jgi:capsular polysaccharide biosynthesis protein
VDFWDLTRLLFRRWYIAVPLLLATLAGAAATLVLVKPDYTTTSYVQLVPPSVTPSTNPAAAAPSNPWMDLGLGSLTRAAIYAAQDQKFLEQLEDEGLSVNVVVSSDYPMPMAMIEVVGATPEQATETANRVAKRLEEVIVQLQKDYAVKESVMISTHRLDQGDNIKESGGKVKRAAVAVGAAGMLLTVGLTIGFDALMRRRRRRPGDDTGGSPTPDTAAASATQPIEWPGGGGGVPRTRIVAGVANGDQGRASSTAPPAQREPYRTPLPSQPVEQPTRAGVGVDETAMLGPVSADATIILPMKNRDFWAAGDNGGKRH